MNSTTISAAALTTAALAAVATVNPVTGADCTTSHHRALAGKIGQVFHLEAKLASLHASLATLAEEARSVGVPDTDIVAMVKAAAQAAGISKSTLSRVLLAAGIRQRATSEKRAADNAEKAALTPEKAEAAVKAILSGLEPEERAAVIARLAAW